jgi:hypothetical protein
MVAPCAQQGTLFSVGIEQLCDMTVIFVGKLTLKENIVVADNRRCRAAFCAASIMSRRAAAQMQARAARNRVVAADGVALDANVSTPVFEKLDAHQRQVDRKQLSSGTSCCCPKEGTKNCEVVLQQQNSYL